MFSCWIMIGGVIWLGALVGGLAFLRRAVKHRSGASWLGAVLLLGPLLLHARWCHRTDVDNWNPMPPREALHGRWTHDNSTLELFADGTFRVDARGDAATRIHITSGSGRWTLVDYHLTLDPGDGHPRRLRVVISNGAYRIIEAPEDFGTWPPWTGFNRSPSSPRR